MTATTDTPPGSLAEALARLQTQLPSIAKDRTAKVKGKTRQGADFEYSYKYADLVTISDAVLPLLGSLGLSFIARPTLRDDGRLVLAYELLHSSGGSMGGTFPLQMARDKEPTPQEIGSLITYARRYCLCAVTGAAADDDDDGHAAQQAATRPARTPRAPRQPAGSRKLEGADLREHNALRREGERHDGKLETGIKDPDPADPWASVDTNGERQPPGDLPVTYPPGDRQIRALAMHFRRLGYDDGLEQDREERLVFLAALAGAGEISSSKELTQDQVKLALTRLEKVKDRTALLDAVEELKESEGASA